MIKKLISGVITTLLIAGVTPVEASAQWRQNSDNSWSYIENGFQINYGWKQINGKWYYFKLNKMQKGWLNDGKWYYLGIDGAMKTGWIEDGEKKYYLNSDGSLETNTIVDGCYVDLNGVALPKEKQKVLLDNEYVKITFLGIIKMDNSKQVKIQVENKSNQYLLVQTRNVSVNGHMVEGLFSPNVEAGKSAISQIEFNNSDITNGFNNITGKFLTIANDYETLDEADFSIELAAENLDPSNSLILKPREEIELK
jgi:hypothetical protein